VCRKDALATSPFLFLNADCSRQFNVGSPYNVHAGHSADLSQLIAHYEEKNRITAEKVEKRLQEQRQTKEFSDVKVI
jgi:hypothetical protein